MDSNITIPAALIIPCDDRCMWAKEEDCDCVCGGKNHQQGPKLNSVQRTVQRTRVGRRIPLLTPGTPEWDTAWTMLEMRDEDGETQRDIAAALGVSAPTVRRMIKSLNFTLAVAEAQGIKVKKAAAKAAKKEVAAA